MSSRLLPVLQSVLSAGCAGLTCSLPLKHDSITGTNHDFWELYSPLGPASENGDSDAPLKVPAHATPAAESSAYSIDKLSSCTECPAVSGKLSRCSDRKSVGAVSRFFLGLSLHGPVVKINKAMHRCLRGQWGKGERKKTPPS